MATRHVVEAGECISSIALKHGFAPETLWDDPGNADLKALRRDRNVLLADRDEVFIPDLRPREETGATNRRHRFVRRGVTEVLRLRLLDAQGAPREGLAYLLDVDGVLTSGRTGTGDEHGGQIERAIAPDAREATLRIRDAGREEVYSLALGHLAPLSEEPGVRERLRNLGYLRGEELGDAGAALRGAIAAFQSAHKLEATGECDAATTAALEALYLARGE